MGSYGYRVDLFYRKYYYSCIHLPLILTVKSVWRSFNEEPCFCPTTNVYIPLK